MSPRNYIYYVLEFNKNIYTYVNTELDQWKYLHIVIDLETSVFRFKFHILRYFDSYIFCFCTEILMYDHIIVDVLSYLQTYISYVLDIIGVFLILNFSYCVFQNLISHTILFYCIS